MKKGEEMEGEEDEEKADLPMREKRKEGRKER